MRVPDRDPGNWPVVVSLHGIRTTGRWQKELTDVLTRSGYRHVPLDFGFFGALSLLWPASRARKVEWFHALYSEKFASLPTRPSLVAHSFGTYIVTEAIRKYADIAFDRVILCGSIVKRDYPWSQIIFQRRQVSRVLNEGGGRDVWVRMAEAFVVDAGTSGVHGFDDEAKGRVTNVLHEAHEHSDYFYLQNYQSRWLPFLSGVRLKKVVPLRRMSPNRRHYVVVVATLLLVSAFMVMIGLGLSGRWSGWWRDAVVGSAAVDPDGDVPDTMREEKVVIPELPDSVGQQLEPIPAEELPPLPPEAVPSESSGSNLSGINLHRFLAGKWLAKKPTMHFASRFPSGTCYEEQYRMVRLMFPGAPWVTGRLAGRWQESVVMRKRFSRNIDVEFSASDQAGCLGSDDGAIDASAPATISMTFSGKIVVSFDRYSDVNGLPFVTTHDNCSDKCTLSEFNKNSYMSVIGSSTMRANTFDFQKE